jgi:hypothetical protein
VELAEFRFRLDTSPTLRLLRSSNAAEVLRFLHASFKAEYRLSIPSDDLTAKLQTYLETEVHPTAPLTLPDERAEALPAASLLGVLCWNRGRDSLLRRPPALGGSNESPVFAQFPVSILRTSVLQDNRGLSIRVSRF